MAQCTCEVSKDSFCPLSSELWPNVEMKNGAIFRVNRNSVAGLHGSQHIPVCFCGWVCPSLYALYKMNQPCTQASGISMYVCIIVIKKYLL